MNFLDCIARRVLLLDGAMSTELAARAIVQKGECCELLNLTRPMDVLDIHQAYVDAGADILTANTFGANPLRLSQFDLLARAEELIQSGVALCKETVSGLGRKVYVAASIGPSGELYHSDPAMPRRMYDAFYAQCSHAAAAGADLLLIETMSDLREARLALLAARASCKLDVLVSFTLEPDAHTYTGSPPEVLALIAKKLGAAMCGVNCALAPEAMFQGFSQLSGASGLPAFAAPNAATQSGARIAPEDMAEGMLAYLHAGASAIGGCCHTTPAHIKALRALIDGYQGHARRPAMRGEYLCSPFSRVPLIDLEETEPLSLKGMTLTQALSAATAAAGGARPLHIDFADWDGESIRALLFALDKSAIPATPLAFHVHAARQANAALFAYPGIAAIYAHADANRVLKSAVRYGAEVII